MYIGMSGMAAHIVRMSWRWLDVAEQVFKNITACLMYIQHLQQCTTAVQLRSPLKLLSVPLQNCMASTSLTCMHIRDRVDLSRATTRKGRALASAHPRASIHMRKWPGQKLWPQTHITAGPHLLHCALSWQGCNYTAILDSVRSRAATHPLQQNCHRSWLSDF